MLQKILNKVISGSNKRPLTLDLFFLENSQKKPLVIFVHGFKGFKDWGHFNLFAEHFALNNFAFLKFNFSYNGTTPEDPLNFTDLEAFGQNNYITELDDLDLIIDHIQGWKELSDEMDLNRIYLLGHSRGGGIAILKSAEDSRIKKLVTWASVSHFLDRSKAETIREWREKGVVYTYNARTKQQMPLYFQFYESLQNNKARLNIPQAASSLKIPFLIIHGKKDEAVDFKEGEELASFCRQAEMFAVENGNHTFGISHPWKENFFPEPANTVIQKTLLFLGSR